MGVNNLKETHRENQVWYYYYFFLLHYYLLMLLLLDGELLNGFYEHSLLDIIEEIDDEN